MAASAKRTKTPPPSASAESSKTAARPVTALKQSKAKVKDVPPSAFANPQLKGTGKVHSSELAYKGRVFSVYSEDVEEPGGHRGTRDVIRHNGSVVILAVDETNPRKPLVVVGRQYRHAAGQFLWELPAGRIEPGEKPLAAAKREMIEETGYRAKKWTLLTRYYASPGFLGEWMQIYLAQGITPGASTPEEDEKIEVRAVPLAELLRAIAANEIHDGKTIVGTMLYDAGRRAKRF
jgi:ADP-ribose pyrophosphatase